MILMNLISVPGVPVRNVSGWTAGILVGFLAGVLVGVPIGFHVGVHVGVQVGHPGPRPGPQVRRSFLLGNGDIAHYHAANSL